MKGIEKVPYVSLQSEPITEADMMFLWKPKMEEKIEMNRFIPEVLGELNFISVRNAELLRNRMSEDRQEQDNTHTFKTTGFRLEVKNAYNPSEPAQTPGESVRINRLLS